MITDQWIIDHFVFKNYHSALKLAGIHTYDEYVNYYQSYLVALMQPDVKKCHGNFYNILDEITQTPMQYFDDDNVIIFDHRRNTDGIVSYDMHINNEQVLNNIIEEQAKNQHKFIKLTNITEHEYPDEINELIGYTIDEYVPALHTFKNDLFIYFYGDLFETYKEEITLIKFKYI